MATQPQDTHYRQEAHHRREQKPQTRTEAETGAHFGRATSAVAGTVLLVYGLKRRSFVGTALALAGGWLLFRATGEPSGRRDHRVTHEYGATHQRPPAQAVGRWDERWTEITDKPAVSRSITVGESADDAYEMWRNPEQFSEIMGHFAEIHESTEDTFHWTIHGPRGRTTSWETHIVEDEPGEIIRWRTSPNATLPNEGVIRFREAPEDRGTMVTVAVRFDPPAGKLGSTALERFDIVPETLIGEALQRFKSLAETGEIPTLEHNPAARERGDLG